MAHVPYHEGPPEPVAIDYTNHQGIRGTRRIIPIKMWFGVSDWHLAPQWFIRAVDLDKGESRDFALLKIHGWTETARQVVRESAEPTRG